MEVYKVRLAKESFKFSSTHFTLFSSTQGEALHGHNYQISVECELNRLGPMGMAFEFNELKPHIKALADMWDERVLMPSACPHLKIREEVIHGTPHLGIEFGNRAYRFPKDEVILLDCENITSEELARMFAAALAERWARTKTADSTLEVRVLSLSVTIEETRGQSATYTLKSPLVRLDLR